MILADEGLKNNLIVREHERCIDILREMEFECIMLSEQLARGKQRGEARLSDLTHKIEITRLNHGKIIQESKFIFSSILLFSKGFVGRAWC